MENVNLVLSLHGEGFKHNPAIHNEMLKRYVCQSMRQENLGILEDNVVEQIIQSTCTKDIVDHGETLEYKDTVGFIEAYNHLHNLSQDEDGGLLENNLICEVHKILMKHRKKLCTVGEYSVYERVVEFEGNIHHYSRPYDMEKEMQTFIDEYNRKWCALVKSRLKDTASALKTLIRLMAWFVYTFLELHGFGDGNGRMIRLLYSYIMEAYGFPFQVPLFSSSKNEFSDGEKEYAAWCKLLWNTRVTGDFVGLENHLLCVLKTWSEAYAHVCNSTEEINEVINR